MEAPAALDIKYRGLKSIGLKCLSDVVGNEETLIRLSAIAKDGNLPNIILCGPPGTGKVGQQIIV